MKKWLHDTRHLYQRFYSIIFFVQVGALRRYPDSLVVVVQMSSLHACSANMSTTHQACVISGLRESSMDQNVREILGLTYYQCVS